MNARQTKKLLKKQIDKLRSDNDLMHKIISDSPSMQELYDRWKQPLNVVHSSMRFEKFEAKRTGVEVILNEEFTKQLVARDLLEKVKDSITYKVDTDGPVPTVTASIIIGYSWKMEV